jgi:hypothetical protein
MQALMERPGAILSRAQMEDRLYGWGEEVESNAVDVLIHSIRKKFDKDIIRNVRGCRRERRDHGKETLAETGDDFEASAVTERPVIFIMKPIWGAGACTPLTNS